MWNTNWQVTNTSFSANWIDAHNAAAAELGKPLLLEEVRSNVGCAKCAGVSCDSAIAALKLQGSGASM